MFHYYNTQHPLLPYSHSLPGQLTPGSVPPLNSLVVEPPLGSDGKPLPGQWPVLNAAQDGWDTVPDHRQRTDDQGRVLEGSGTPYWLPGDSYLSPARHVQDLGPLPENALRVRPEKPAPTVPELQAFFTQALQGYLDDFARTRNYDTMLSACTYATSTVPRFQKDGQYCVEMRDAVWAVGYALLEKVLSGERDIPTLDEVFAELPALEWPA